MKTNGVVLAALALFATLVHAEDYLSPTEERVRLSLGAVRLSNDTNLQLDSSAGVPGTPVNAENAFGLDKSDFEAKIEAMVRVGERHRLQFDYFSLDRTNSTTVTQPIVFRDVVLQPGDPLDTDLSIRTFSISYGYSFLHSDKYEVAATIGVNDTDISARARVQTATRHVDQTEDQAGPFPTLGLAGDLYREQALLFRRPRAVHESSDRSTGRVVGDLRAGCAVPSASEHFLRVGLQHAARQSHLSAGQTSGIFQFQLEGSRILRQDRLLESGRRAGLDRELNPVVRRRGSCSSLPP